MPVEFHGMRFDLPQGWLDITEDLPEGGPPSIARPGGVGALQFTFARYKSGENPGITIDVLRDLLREFFVINKISGGEFVEYHGHVMSVQGMSDSSDEFILARYFSNGRDVVLATYICSVVNSIETQEDLTGVEMIMNSMEF
jgi:hypothetical protein